MQRLFLRRCMATFARTNRDGSTTNIVIRPSYAQKPKAVENLMKSLPEILAANPKSSNGTTQTSPLPSPDSNSNEWTLDDTGDTIHRHISFSNETLIPTILEQIKTASRDLNHDPHVYVDGARLTISCTTHVPPGLSMKDVKLARRINEILGDERLVLVSGGEAEGEGESEQRAHAERENMKAIKKAKEDCSCG